MLLFCTIVRIDSSSALLTDPLLLGPLMVKYARRRKSNFWLQRCSSSLMIDWLDLLLVLLLMLLLLLLRLLVLVVVVGRVRVG